MSSIGVSALLRCIPPFISVSSGPLLDDVPPLSQAERASISTVAPMSPVRLTEFAHGRKHARHAMEQLGVVAPSIPRSANRSPVWPQGFVGSISHVPANPQRNQPGWVIAAAARLEHCASLGIDLERTDSLMPEHWALYMTAHELAWIAQQPPRQRNDLAHGLWSAKEAVMKALTRPSDPHSIEIRVLDGGLSFEAKCRTSQGSATVNTPSVNGWFAYENGCVLAVAVLPTRPT
jgi:4'-phosphopantetheinyl transferase EntD